MLSADTPTISCQANRTFTADRGRHRAFSAGSDVTTIEVISARADWVELLVPCTRDAADRIQSFVQQLARIFLLKRAIHSESPFMSCC